MMVTATGRAGSGNDCWRTIHCPRLAHLDTRLLDGRSRDGNFRPRLRRNPTRQERNTIRELFMATAAEAADMLRVGRSGVYRLIVATQWESIKIGRSRRVSVASIGHVAAQSATVGGVDARTQPSGGSATPGQAEEAGDVLTA
jgi:excisionase family DNA binding protein